MHLSVHSQENGTILSRKAQVTFAYPIGSNGSNSLKYSNNFSFNILYGLNGGVNGVEIGSLLNYIKGEVNGFQLAGISNINTKQSKGFLLSGVSNICMDSTSGVLISGVLNYSKQSKGFQLATANIVDNESKGFQLGVINYTKKLNGLQLGVINVVGNSENGIPIGIFNVVKNGYYDLEMTAGEVLYFNLNYKMGVDKFYTIFKTGISTFNDKSVYSYGVGFGGRIPFNERHKLSIDVTANHIIYDNDWEWGEWDNLLNKADINYRYGITNNFSVIVGPSINVYVTKKIVNGEYGTLNIPYTIYSNESSGNKLFMWIGLNAGMSLKF
jgi:hypothetical protein